MSANSNHNTPRPPAPPPAGIPIGMNPHIPPPPQSQYHQTQSLPAPMPLGRPPTVGAGVPPLPPQPHPTGYAPSGTIPLPIPTAPLSTAASANAAATAAAAAAATKKRALEAGAGAGGPLPLAAASSAGSAGMSDEPSIKKQKIAGPNGDGTPSNGTANRSPTASDVKSLHVNVATSIPGAMNRIPSGDASSQSMTIARGPSLPLASPLTPSAPIPVLPATPAIPAPSPPVGFAPSASPLAPSPSMMHVSALAASSVLPSVNVVMTEVQTMIGQLKEWRTAAESELMSLRAQPTAIRPAASAVPVIAPARPLTVPFGVHSPHFTVLDSLIGKVESAYAARLETAGLGAGGFTIEDLESRKAELARKIKEFQATAGKVMRASPEAPRNKTHWDFLLSEMTWMANDFQRERKWKTIAAKRIGRGVRGYEAKKHAEQSRMEKKEELDRKKGANAVCKLIKKFWTDISKIVLYVSLPSLARYPLARFCLLDADGMI